MQMELYVALIGMVSSLILGVVVSGYFCFQAGIKHRIKSAEAQFESAEKEAARIVEEAGEKAESLKKTALVEAKDEIYAMRSN